MKIRALLLIGIAVIFNNMSYSQNSGDVAINEIMYAPTPSTNEWFELYNNTANPINLANWKWKDATATLRIITTLSININSGGYAIVCEDSATFRTTYPGFSGILLQPNNGWSSLNNTGDQLILFSGSGTQIDSINFTSSWGGSTGSRSMERVNSTAPTNQQSNWGTSVATAGATPNLRNSISPLNNDLALNILSFSSNSPVLGTNLQITANVKNRGLLLAAAYTVSFYEDYNKDSIPVTSELISTVNSAGPLSPGDSANYSTSDLLDSLGLRQYIAVVTYALDEDTLNNKRIGQVNVIPAGSFDSLIVNEIMYAPTTNTGKEWFEIYNKKSSPVSLANWKWKDATSTIQTITTQTINIPANGYAVICEDSAAVKGFYPSNIGIYIQTSWSALNNTGDNVIIINPAGVIIDSITFTSSWGGSTGNKSLERISFTQPTNQQSNWGTSVAFAGATPNLRNSVSPIDNDLVLNLLSFSNNTPLIGSNLQINANVKNRGLLSAATYTVSFYEDYNKDSIPVASELITTVNSAGALNPGDSANYNANDFLDSLGIRQYIAVVTYALDGDTTNNKRIGQVNVIPAGSFDSLVVNEIMYAPTTGTGKEWFEIFNKTSNPVDLANWKWKDATSTIQTITTQSINIPANGYAVICEDSIAIKGFYPLNTGVYIQTNWSALNNTGDNVILINPIGVIIDSITFTSSWGGSTGNKSLERISVSLPTNQQSNWGTCVSPFGATPNRVNSLTPKPNDLALSSIAFSRPLPAIGDTLGITAAVKNRGLNQATSYTVSFYDDYNRDSIPNPAELKITINSAGTLNPGDSANYTYSQILDSAGFRQYIAVVTYALDDDTTNNKLTKGIEVSGGSTAGRVLVNEIMYDPPTGECEWVELFNNSDSIVNLKNWKIQDNGTTQVIITAVDYFLNPDQFVVISQDDTIFSEHPGLKPEKVIVNSSLPSLNNSGDAVIIYKLNNLLSDRVDYLPDWGGTKVSLERININGASGDSSNWASSIDCEKSTPARENSISSATHYSAGDLIINEIMAGPLSGDAEYVELYNPTSQTINIVGWLYSETGSTKGISDTCAAMIKPGSYVVIASDTTIYNTYSYLRTPDSTQKVFIIGSLGLNNDGDLVKISDVFRTKIDSVYYSDNWYNPNLPGSGRSLEKINPSLNGNDGKNWSSCTYPNGGSPGLRNSIFTNMQPGGGQVTISPNPFSPDGDGFEDFTIISYKLSNTVSQVRLKIFDVKGRLIKTILNNQTSGSQGQIVYNGLDDENRKLRLGIYIVFLEALNDQNGVVETIKTTMVLAAKL